MIKKYLASAICSLLAVGGLAACGSSGSGSSGSSAKTISYIEAGALDFSDGDQSEFLKMLKAEGYKVNVSTVSDAATALRAIVAGKADFFLAPPTEAILADVNGGAHVKAIAGESQASDYVILSLPRYNLTNLTGATMAIASPGTAGQVTADAALAIKGIDPSKIHNVTVGDTTARVSAILSGKVDLAPVLSASAVPALDTGRVKILLNTGSAIGLYLEGMLVSNQSYLSKNSKTAQAVVNALLNAERWANSNEAGYISLMNAEKDSGGLTQAQEQAAWKAQVGIHLYAVNGGMCASTIARTLTISYQTDALPKSVHPADSVWLDRTYVDNYLKAHNQPQTVC